MDVGAKAELYAIINMLAEQGVGIIMISSELRNHRDERPGIGDTYGGLPEAIRGELNQEKLSFGDRGVKDAS